jgi:hypothetical protein
MHVEPEMAWGCNQLAVSHLLANAMKWTQFLDLPSRAGGKVLLVLQFKQSWLKTWKRLCFSLTRPCARSKSYAIHISNVLKGFSSVFRKHLARRVRRFVLPMRRCTSCQRVGEMFGFIWFVRAEQEHKVLSKLSFLGLAALLCPRYVTKRRVISQPSSTSMCSSVASLDRAWDAAWRIPVLYTVYTIYIYLYIIYRYGHNKLYVLPKSTVSQVIPRKSDTPRKQAKWFRYKKGWEQDWQNPSRMGGISILHFDWESKIIIELEMNSEDPKRSMKAPLLLGVAGQHIWIRTQVMTITWTWLGYLGRWSENMKRRIYVPTEI